MLDVITLFHRVSELQTWADSHEKHHPIHLAAGAFDGVHRGHQAVIASAKEQQSLRGGKVVVLTFDPHPARHLRPDQAPKLLTPGQEQWVRLAQTGVDAILALPFDQSMAECSAMDFAHQLFLESSHIQSISMGSDWTFGKNRQGTSRFMREMAEAYGVSTHIIEDQLDFEGVRISSTMIRRHLKAGCLSRVRKSLGRFFSLSGEVIQGRQLARTLGFPTANLKIDIDRALPPLGVYLIQSAIDGIPVKGVANLGFRPTVESDVRPPLWLECHFFDFNQDLYGKTLVVDLLSFLRPEKKFSDIQQLQQAIELDLKRCRLRLNRCLG